MRKLNCALATACVVLAGCGANPAAVLEGTWSATPVDTGDFDGWQYEARFDSNGDLVELSGTRVEDGATASLAIDDATTEVDGSEVVITIPDVAGARVFEGTLSADQNTITGTSSQEIDLGDLEASVPSGDLTLERVS